jgi:glucosamine--fructose-6-phosphate aminotransferase (isomerizing)
MLSVELAAESLNAEELEHVRNGLHRAPQLVKDTLRTLNSQIRRLAKKYRQKKVLFLLGSGPNYATALEAALKLKETCTVYAEGFATREFLHGPMRLVDERTLVIMIVSPDEVESDLEVGRSLRNFGAPVIFVSEESASSARFKECSDEVVLVPRGLPKVFSPLLYVIPLQLFAYYSSVFRGLNPDKPEKLSKVVK